MSVESESTVYDSTANPYKEILIDNFKFTKAEDILFAFEMDGENVFNLLCNRIYEKAYVKATENTAMFEVIATVILGCQDKNAIEELYLVNLLHFEDLDVGLWKGVTADWEFSSL